MDEYIKINEVCIQEERDGERKTFNLGGSYSARLVIAVMRYCFNFCESPRELFDLFVLPYLNEITRPAVEEMIGALRVAQATVVLSRDMLVDIIDGGMDSLGASL